LSSGLRFSAHIRLDDPEPRYQCSPGGFTSCARGLYAPPCMNSCMRFWGVEGRHRPYSRPHQNRRTLCNAVVNGTNPSSACLAVPLSQLPIGYSLSRDGKQTPRRPRQSELAKMPMNSEARRARNRARFLLSATLDLWRASFPAQGSQVLRPKPPTVDGADPWAADFKTKGSQAPKRKGVGADNLGQVIGYLFNL
jgi:hypothetical protein